MFDTFIDKLLASVLNGGNSAIFAVFLLVIAVLLFERVRMYKDAKKKEDKIEKIVDDYYTGSRSLSDTLNNLRIVLYEIKSKL